MSWLRWFGYGLGRSAARTLFREGADERTERSPPEAPVRPQTEAEILAAERRYDAEAEAYRAEDEARKSEKVGAS
jgi:hypothetical protein